MAKKPEKELPEVQSERFKRNAQRLIDAGELNPTEAEAAMDRLVKQSKPLRSQ